MNSTILFWLWFTDFFTYSCLFSIQSYIKPLLISNSGIKCRETSLLDMFIILRMVTAYLFTSLGDKLNKRYVITMCCLLGYCFVVTTITFFLPILGAEEFGVKMICINFAYEGFESGVLPLLETMSVTISTQFGGKYAYAIMRSALVLGRISGHLLPALYNKFYFHNDPHQHNHFFAMLTWACIAFPLLYIMHLKSRNVEVKEEEDISLKCGTIKSKSTASEGNIFTNLFEILLSEYVFVLLILMFYGVFKTALVNYQSLFTNTIFDEREYTAMIYIFRSFPELFTTLICPFFEGIIGNVWIIFVGGICGLVKTFIYAFFPIGATFRTKMALFLLLEIFKAFFCDWVCYGATKLTKFYNPMRRRATAQGLFNGFFNGACAFISGIIGFYTLGTEINLENIQHLQRFFLLCGYVGLVGVVINISLGLIRDLNYYETEGY